MNPCPDTSSPDGELKAAWRESGGLSPIEDWIYCASAAAAEMCRGTPGLSIR